MNLPPHVRRFVKYRKGKRDEKRPLSTGQKSGVIKKTL
jgi:hypothetical protein